MPKPPTPKEIEDAKLVSQSVVDGKFVYEIHRLGGRYFAVFPERSEMILTPAFDKPSKAVNAADAIAEALSTDPHVTKYRVQFKNWNGYWETYDDYPDDRTALERYEHQPYPRRLIRVEEHIIRLEELPEQHQI